MLATCNLSFMKFQLATNVPRVTNISFFQLYWSRLHWHNNHHHPPPPLSMACPGTQEDEQEHHPSLLTLYYVPDTVLYSGLVIFPCTGIELAGFQMVY